VLLNVDNPRWQPEIERYDVNGIPHLEMFNRSGNDLGRSIGARSRAELDSLATALIDDRPLPVLAGLGATSSLTEPPGEVSAAASQVGPRSHG
jgi:hypothetical protein